MIRCQARIKREYKRRKAAALYPVYFPNSMGTPEPNPHVVGLPECGGEVTIQVQVIEEPYFGGSSPVLNVRATCSRCDAPYWDGKAILDLDPAGELAATYVLVMGRAGR